MEITYDKIELNDINNNKKIVIFDTEMKTDSDFVQKCIRFLEAPKGEYTHRGRSIKCFNSISKTFKFENYIMSITLEENYRTYRTNVIEFKKYEYLNGHVTDHKYEVVIVNKKNYY